MSSKWSVASVWNKALEASPKRTYEPRDRIWASELYNSDIDLVLKMRGEQPTNPPDSRALRKMDAGRMFEDFVDNVLRRAGILQSTQDRVSFHEENMIEVSGKIDFLAGGTPDMEQLQKLIDEIEDDSSFTKRLLVQVRDNFSHTELEEKIIELKSASLFAYNKVEATGKALRGHGLQAFHYAYNLKKPTYIVYICRDDMRMLEIEISPDNKELEAEYLEKIKTISQYHKSGELPPPEPLIDYDFDDGKFSKNFRVEYSPYLTMLYNFKTPAEYDEMFAKRVIAWNGVMKRIRDGKEMTKLNQERLAEIKEFGFDLDVIINNQKELAEKGVVSEEENDQ